MPPSSRTTLRKLPQTERRGAPDWKTRDANEAASATTERNGTPGIIRSTSCVLSSSGAGRTGRRQHAGIRRKARPQGVDAILAWVQSHWSDKIYAIWHERTGLAASGGAAGNAKMNPSGMSRI